MFLLIQECHEELRVLSHEAGAQVKEFGKENDLTLRIKKSIYFEPIWNVIDTLLDPVSFIGRAPEQVNFLITCIIFKNFNRVLKLFL